MNLLENAQAAAADRSGRGLAHYEVMFGTLAEQLGEQSLLLDVGAGDSTLAYELKQQNNPIQVVNIDYGYKNLPPYFDVDAGRTMYTSTAVAGKAEALPFKNDTFDVTYASWLFMHLTPRLISRSTVELTRVTKSDGIVGIGPLLVRESFYEQSMPEGTELRRPTHKDGWGRPLGSLIIRPGLITDPEATEAAVKNLADARAFGNRKGAARLARIASSQLHMRTNGQSRNRRYGIRNYELSEI